MAKTTLNTILLNTISFQQNVNICVIFLCLSYDKFRKIKTNISFELIIFSTEVP